VAPDTTPGWFNDEASYTSSSPRYLKRVIGVAFHETATVAERTTAISSIEAEVVGGWRLSPQSDGLYAVFVATVQNEVQLHELIDRLRTFGQVKAAFPIYALEFPPAGRPQ
jgi:hypothetical protein